MHVFQCILIISKFYFCHSWNIRNININTKSFPQIVLFCRMPIKLKKKKKQNTNYQGLWDNLLILFIQKQFLGTNQALCAKGKQWIKLTRPFAYRSYSIVLREIQLFTLFSFRYLFLIITNIKNREILKLKDSLSSGQILSTLHYKVFLYF